MNTSIITTWMVLDGLDGGNSTTFHIVILCRTAVAICVDANFWLFSRTEKSTHGQLFVCVGGWGFPMKGIVTKGYPRNLKPPTQTNN